MNARAVDSQLIDVHAHAVFLFGEPAPTGPGFTEWSPERAVEHMDKYGIQASVLSVPDAASGADAPAARDAARRINEALAEVVQAYPTRFGALATIPGGDPEGALAEIAYALDELHFDGVATSTSIGEDYLGEPAFDPWFAELASRKATLFIHPALPARAASDLLGMHVSVIEFMFQTTRALTNLVMTGTRRKFADINMVTTHAGGTLPYLIRRIETLQHTFGVGDGRLTLSPAEVRGEFACFYYDLTAGSSAFQLHALLELVPPSQLLVGLDFPFMPQESFAPAVADLQHFTALNDGFAQVRSENAKRLFRRLGARLA